jgi:hypothetical protein
VFWGCFQELGAILGLKSQEDSHIDVIGYKLKRITSNVVFGDKCGTVMLSYECYNVILYICYKLTFNININNIIFYL